MATSHQDNRKWWRFAFDLIKRTKYFIEYSIYSNFFNIQTIKIYFQFESKLDICCILTNQMTDNFHLLLCIFNNGFQHLKGFIPDWKTWVTAFRLHYVNCSGDSWVEGVHRYLRQSGFMRILSAIVLFTLGVLLLSSAITKRWWPILDKVSSLQGCSDF